ncbi:hypothetical protein [uncultured Megasphaera sp.]|jgi:hypothetical protein|uniref:hypothetical protein n=1 Tax=Megasphaera sp. TaxID=2023260 RepID=UPI00267068A3|nr:hypothetical protein [uncultured Megasphaera sp.]
MTQEKWQDTLVSIKNKVCTARNAKIAAAFCVVCVVATAGGHYYLHQQHLARHAERVDAMAQMTKAQADQHNISLISEDQACAAAAQAIGKDESELTFKEIALFDMNSAKHGPKDGRKGDRKEKPKAKDRKGDERGEQRGPEGMKAGRPGADAAAGATAKAAADGQADKQVVPMTPPQGQPDRNGQPPQGAMPQNAFHPMYKVRVTSGSVRYDVLVDATNGTIIHTEIED